MWSTLPNCQRRVRGMRSIPAGATELCCEDFPTGFTLRDSPGFGEWHFFQSEGLSDELAVVLERLAAGSVLRGNMRRPTPAPGAGRYSPTQDPLPGRRPL
jgi:hypothetical protein